MKSIIVFFTSITFIVQLPFLAPSKQALDHPQKISTKEIEKLIPLVVYSTTNILAIDQDSITNCAVQSYQNNPHQAKTNISYRTFGNDRVLIQWDEYNFDASSQIWQCKSLSKLARKRVQDWKIIDFTISDADTQFSPKRKV